MRKTLMAIYDRYVYMLADCIFCKKCALQIAMLHFKESLYTARHCYSSDVRDDAPKENRAFFLLLL